MASEKKNLRDALRAKTLGVEKKFRTKIIEYEGEKYELRQPSVGARADMMNRCSLPIDEKALKDGDEQTAVKMDYGKMQIYAVIHCTFVPGSDIKVFEEDDFDSLYNMPTGSFVDEFSKEAMQLMNVAPKDAAKN